MTLIAGMTAGGSGGPVGEIGGQRSDFGSFHGKSVTKSQFDGMGIHSRVRPADERQPDLPQPEQIEMVDQERDRQDGRPSGGKQRPEHEASGGVFNRPDVDPNRSPGVLCPGSAKIASPDV